MALKTGIFSLALGSLLLGSTAFAADAQQLQAPKGNTQVQAQSFRGGTEQHSSWGNTPPPPPGNGNGGIVGGRYNDRDGAYRHTPQPPAPRHQQGRYERKLVQQWVPGGYERVWVPQSCNYRSQCTGGRYEQRWVAGHYESVEQWVWVSTGNHGGRWG